MSKTFKTTEEEIQTFTDLELRMWNKGYLEAIRGIVEQLNCDQVKVLNALLEIDDWTQSKETRKAILQSKLKVLDGYEEFYARRLTYLEKNME